MIAGTHDLGLAARTLEELRGLGSTYIDDKKTDDTNKDEVKDNDNDNDNNKDNDNDNDKVEDNDNNKDNDKVVFIPQYDKSLRLGRGDRAHHTQWITATGK